MSNHTLLDTNDKDHSEQAETYTKTDTASQITLLDASDLDPEYDSKIPSIWQNRYSSFAGFAAYVRHCIALGWKECLRISAFLWRKSWTAEVCSFIIAVASLLGLIITLSIHDKRHLITLNSVVSLFALLTRVGMGIVLAEGISQTKWHWFGTPRSLYDMERFDLASRSALGSARLLYFLGRRDTFYVTSVGALAMIMVSLTGFFSQQVLQFQDCLQPNTTVPPRIAKTNTYLRSGEAIGSLNVTSDSKLFLGMVAAINVAIFKPVEDYTNVLTTRCTSGFCTFPTVNGASFSTLAISHSCENVTSKALFPRSPWSRGGIVSLRGETDSLIKLNLLSDTVITTRTDARTNESLSSLATMYVINRPLESEGKCSGIDLSLENIERATTAGFNLTETLVESLPLESYGTSMSLDQRFSYLTVTTSTLRNSVREACNASDTYDSRLSDYHKADRLSNGTVRHDSKILYYPKDCIWGFGQGAATSIGQYFIGQYFSNIFDNKTLTLTELKRSTYTSIYLRQLWQNETMSLSRVDGVMGHISTAMTAVVRTEGTEGDYWHLEGTMMSTTTCVIIQWPWLAFPIVTIVLTGVFLMFVVLENRKVAGDRLWKSSVLATLFCEVEHDRMDETKTICKEAMFDMAKSTSVSVEGRKGTLKLVAQ